MKQQRHWTGHGAACSPSEFKPGDTFERVIESSERIVFVRLAPEKVPDGKTVRRGGRTMLDERPQPAKVQAAIRADRDL